jgi:DNA-binding transcriptional MerR regulator
MTERKLGSVSVVDSTLLESGLPADRKYFKIGEIAALLKVEPHVLRYWETQFSQVRPVKARSGHRLYRRRDVDHLVVIHNLLHVQRYTIVGARESLRRDGLGKLLPLLLPEPASRSSVVRNGGKTQPPTDAYATSIDGEPVDDSADEPGGVVLHLASPADADTEVFIEALDGDELSEALAHQLVSQRGKAVTRVELDEPPNHDALRAIRDELVAAERSLLALLATLPR